MQVCRRHSTGYLALFLFILLLSPGCGGGGGGNNPPPSPTTTTAAATGISLHIATLNGTVNPHAQATNAWFEWGTDNALVNPTLTTAQAIGAGSADNSVTAPITGLTLGTAYYYRVAATNASGMQKGAIASFTTSLPNSPPSVISNAATSVTISGAILNGTVNPNELATTAVFEWGTDSNLTTFTSTTSQSLGAGTTSVAIIASLSGLIPGTTYYFRVVATNTAGTSTGLIVSFNAVAQPPTVSTAAATSIATSGATLNGTVNPNGLAVSDAHFEYGIDSNLTTFSTTGVQALAAGFAGQPITASLSGLIPGTTYYFRVVATNPAGPSKGLILSFTSSSNPTPNEGIIFSKLFSTFGGAGVFSLDFHPTREYGSGGSISIRIMDTPTTYFEFSTVNASDPSKGSFIKVRKDVVVDSAPFPFPYSQEGTYPIRISMDQSLSTVEAFGETVSLTRDENSNPLVYFEVWTSDQDAYYDNIKMEPGFFDDFSSDTTGTYNLYYISGTNSTFTYDAVGQRAWVRTGSGGP